LPWLSGTARARSHGETHHELRRINLNTASQQEIEDLPMVGPKRAEALIRARPLSSWKTLPTLRAWIWG
jgi:DNA uptake protein ComE-like DNA-binding protein